MSELVHQGAQAAVDKPAPAAAPSKGKSKKALIIVIVVMAQLVAAYFLMGFLLKRGAINADPKPVPASVAKTKTPGDAGFDNVYIVKDLIVNPAGTNGLRFLLTTIGLEATSAETVKELTKREVEIHDVIIGVLTSKTLPQLDDFDSRDSLKAEIKKDINADLTTGQVLNVYFSKFIIQ
ncbi:MAG: flagellar basal body-associated FliL family protein [Bacteroidetes bacterium]|nr:flagellar basal body-associated FliL family protein [Bacteroidota bacterium]